MNVGDKRSLYLLVDAIILLTGVYGTSTASHIRRLYSKDPQYQEAISLINDLFIFKYCHPEDLKYFKNRLPSIFDFILIPVFIQDLQPWLMKDWIICESPSESVVREYFAGTYLSRHIPWPKALLEIRTEVKVKVLCYIIYSRSVEAIVPRLPTDMLRHILKFIL